MHIKGTGSRAVDGQVKTGGSMPGVSAVQQFVTTTEKDDKGKGEKGGKWGEKQKKMKPSF